MLKIHVLYEHGIDSRPHGSAYIRLLLPLGHPVNAQALEVTHDLAYASADVVIVERMWKPDLTLRDTEELVARIRKDRAYLIFTIDDNLLDLKLSGSVRSGFSTEKLMAVRYLAREADGLIVSTDYLKARLARLNRTICVVPNALDERLLPPLLSPPPPAPASRDRKIIGYMGTHTHDADLLMMLQPLRETLRRHQGAVEFQLVGGVSDSAVIRAFENLPLRILDVGEHVEYPAFMRWMAQHAAWDLALAPLEDTAFTRCKSDIKFLDYSSFGIAGIYSRQPAYQHTVRHLDTGYLVDNEPEAWRAALEQLLTDDVLRQGIAQRAQEYVLTSRTLQQCAQNWHAAILSILNSRGLQFDMEKAK